MSALARLWRNPTGRIGLALVVLVLVPAVAAEWVATHDPNALDVETRFAGPSAAHWLGTDNLGRDFYSRIVHGARLAMAVALSTVGIAVCLGMLLGIIAAFAGRGVERVILVAFDIVSAFPSLIFALAVLAALGTGLDKVVAIIAITLIPQFGRIARAQALALRASPFLEAERVLGASWPRLVLVHVAPNILGPMIVLASMDIPVVITIEAGLSFLGVGVRPPLASWGTLLNDGYRFLNQSQWMVIFAGLALTLATLGFTLLGEALRDAIDPKMRTEP